MNNLGKIKFNNKYQNPYFEGWYFKHITNDLDYTLSIIVGISRSINHKISFIQVIDNKQSYYKEYNYSDFSYDEASEKIKIASNTFSINKILVEFDNVYINLDYKDIISLQKDIMGPFNYLKLECFHHIISMKHIANGISKINQNEIIFKNGYGYIEKDYGKSFPKKYLWVNSLCKECSLFLAVAVIPYKCLKFNGFIVAFCIDDKEYTFTTYNLSKIKITKHLDRIDLQFTKKDLKLCIKIPILGGYLLKSPKLGEMNNEVLENVNNLVTVKLTKNDHVIYENVLISTTEYYN